MGTPSQSKRRIPTSIVIGDNVKFTFAAGIDGYSNIWENTEAFWAEDLSLNVWVTINKSDKHGKQLERLIQKSVSPDYLKAWLNVLIVERMPIEDFRKTILNVLRARRDELKGSRLLKSERLS